MGMELSLDQKQVLSQRMQLSVRILQMNALDLDQYIREQVLENPLIELELAEETEDPGLIRLKKLEWLDSVDESNSYQYERSRTEEYGHDVPLYEKNPANGLCDELLAQLPAFHLSEEAETVARYIIGNLDENGYIAISRQQLKAELAVDDALLDEALKALHRMEPSGVGAADLRECLLIQARRMEDASPVLISLIDKHLNMLAKNQLDKLAKIMRVSISEVKEARNQLLALNPKPGNGYSSYKFIPYIRPDIFIIRFEDNFQVIFNDYNQPKIEISAYYRDLARDANSETAGYIRDKLNKAEWLISCVQQRKSTLLKCVDSILKRQTRFFEQGPGNIIPMVLSDVSEDLGMHPSTISRAVRGKYIQCQWGVFDMADFFYRNISGPNLGDSQSQDMALSQIKSIIAEESPAMPFSDQEIANRLKGRGINIARRTIAKYREQMGLPPASGRKKY